MIYPKNPNQKDLIRAIDFNDKKEITILYRMLIEFNGNKYTSDLREFLLKHYKGEK